jgi:hypothetical protein
LSTGAELRDQARSGAVFGAVFGAVDAKLNRVKLSDDTSPEFKKSFPNHNLPSTEKFVKEQYDVHQPLRSPILSWLAEKRPELRPPNYEALNQEVRKNGQFLDLANWSSEGRVKVVQALRTLSESDLTKDAQIDEFIGAVKSRNADVRNQVVDRREAYDRAKIDWHNAFNELIKAKNIHQPNFSLREILAKGAIERQHPDIQAAVKKTLQAETVHTHARTSWPEGLETQNYFVDASASLTKFLRQKQLPDLQFEIEFGRSKMMYGYDTISVNPNQFVRTLAGKQISNEFHEVRHHEDGTFKSDAIFPTIKRWFRGHFSQDGERLDVRDAAEAVRNTIEWMDKGASRDVLYAVADPQNPASRIWARRFNDDGGKSQTVADSIPDEVKELVKLVDPSSGLSELAPLLKERFKEVLQIRENELDTRAYNMYLEDYVGEKGEQRAWSAGLLAQLRTRMWGIPDIASDPQVLALKGTERPEKLSALGYIDTQL